MTKVLITGASGFVGRHCLPLLQSMADEVHLVQHTNPCSSTKSAQIHQLDLFQENQVRELIARIRPERLLHLAWIAKPGVFWTSPENDRWVQASTALVKAFAEHGGQRVVAAGTCAEYDWSAGTCNERATALKPATLYGQAKLRFYQALEQLGNDYGLSVAWGRIFFLYGPYEHPSRLVASVLNALLRDELALCSEGHQQRDFLHVEDVADAFVTLLLGDVEGPVNVASGRTFAIRDVVSRLAELVGKPELVRFGVRPSPSGDPSIISADVSRLREEVQWRPRHTLEDGLAHTLEWWMQRITCESPAPDG